MTEMESVLGLKPLVYKHSKYLTVAASYARKGTELSRSISQGFKV